MHSCFLCIIVFLFSSKRLKADISLFKRTLLATFLKFLKKLFFSSFYCLCQKCSPFLYLSSSCLKVYKALVYKRFFVPYLHKNLTFRGAPLKRRVCEQRVLSVYTVTLSYKWQFWKMVCTTQIDTFFGLCTPTEGRRFASSIRVGLSTEALLLLKEPHKTFP